MAKSLYICYFGIREPLVQTQVVAYLRELASYGHDITLLTFDAETPDPATKGELERSGIGWASLRYHKRFSVLATAYDIFRGAIFIALHIRSQRPDIIHGRAHVATLMGALGIALSGRRSKLLFDIRGLLAEEYTDAGLWPPDGTLFRVAKRVERFLMRRADGFVLLTERIRSVLLSPNDASVDRPIEIIPCCCDVPRLLSDTGNRNEIRARIGAGDRPVIVYVGSFGGWYLSDEMIRFVRTAMEEEPNLFFLVLTQRGTESVRAMLDDAGIKDRDSYVTSVSPQEIGEYLNACDMALSFIKPCMSKLASSPTKLAEYLACGLPVISNSGIGDVDEVLTGERVGVVFDNFDVETYRRAFRDYRGLVRDELTQERCRDVAMRHFDLKTVGGPAYGRLYSRLTKADEL